MHVIAIAIAAASFLSHTAGAQCTAKCCSNEGISGRFPLWPVTYNMQDSTIVQPCNVSGFLDAAHFSQFGLVSVDWSNNHDAWVIPPMSCEELLVEQAALLKAARPGVWVSHDNSVSIHPYTRP